MEDQGDRSKETGGSLLLCWWLLHRHPFNDLYFLHCHQSARLSASRIINTLPVFRFVLKEWGLVSTILQVE